jgi:hypothetical protein
MEVFSLITSNPVLLLTIVGTLAFLVSVITEVTKNIGFLAKIPTDLQVIVLAVLLCQVSYFAYCSYFSINIQWYYIAGCIIAAFIVAFVAMYGWSKLTLLYNRFRKPEEQS